MPQKYFLILFVCYLPVYLCLVFYLKTKIEGYSMHAHMVSYLATSAEPWRSVFNISTILYGALSLALPASLNSILAADHLVTFGIASQLSAGTATVLVGCFPMDRKIKIHNVAGFWAFLSALSAGIVFFLIFSNGLLSSLVMEVLTVAMIGTTVILGVSLLLRRQSSSLLEWLAFICTIVWNFLFSILLLARIL